MNPKALFSTDDEPTLQEETTEPFVPAYRGASSPWSRAPDRPLIFTPRAEDIDFEAAIESFTETQPVEWEDLLGWEDD